MKTKVVIENGGTIIVLSPENEFEKDVIEKVYKKNEAYSINAIVEARYNYGSYDNHKIEMSIKELH